MTLRIRLGRALALAVATSLLVGLAPHGAGVARAVEGSPNIVFFLVDDLDADSFAYMPNVQSLLAERGTTLSNFIYNIALCCPSRATMLRGQYAHNTGVYTQRAKRGGFETFHRRGLEQSTTAVWLQKAGYRTGLIGKYLNGYPIRNSGNQTVPATYVPPGWNEWHVPFGLTEDAPYYGFNYAINDNGVITEHASASEDYVNDVLADRAQSFLEAPSDSPFFIYLAPFPPHDPAVPAPRHTDLFEGISYPQKPSFNEADVSDKPEWVRSQGSIEPGEALPLFPGPLTSADDHYRNRLQSLQSVDEMVGEVISTLEAQGELSNTYIFFASDNGYHIGEHRMVPGKESPYEEDIRVPLIVVGPGVPAGQSRDNLTGNVDIAPTFAEIGGASPENRLDGRSLMPLLGANPPPPTVARQAYLLQHMGHDDRLIPAFKGLRTRTYTYVEYPNGDRELYDLTTDPYQLDNIYATTDPQVLSTLAQRLEKLRACEGDKCREIDSRPVPPL